MTTAPTAAEHTETEGEVEGESLARVAHVLASRFAAGGSLWCVSPSWPEHARHVAVEFVHPVIVGKRALPAVSIVAPDPVAAVRAVSRSGDVVLAVSPSEDARVADLLRRAPAWGVTTVWVASGPRPTSGGADHLVWVDDPDRSAPFDGRLVLRYHLLWEMTHVCFEHPGLVRSDDDAVDRCVTCSDEGRLAEVLGPSDDGLDVAVRTAQGVEVIDASLVGPVQRDDLVLVHAGAAIAALDPTGDDGGRHHRD